MARLLNGVSEDNQATAGQRLPSREPTGTAGRGPAEAVRYNQDNVSTVRDSNGNKGFLLEKAGIEGDITNTRNILSKELDDYDDRIRN